MTKYSNVIGVGYYVPEKIITNQDLEECLDTTDEWIQKKIGIKERHIAANDEVTSDLAARACESALEKAEITAEDVDMILLATNTPDHLSPATAIKVQEKIGATNAFSFDIKVGGCPGMVYGLTIASKFVSDGSCETILVVTSDLNSRSIDWEERLTAVIMGDGASAIVLQASEAPKNGVILNSDLHTDPKGYYGAYVPAGGSVEPITMDSLTNRRQYFSMDGRAIFKFAVQAFPETVKGIVDSAGYSLSDINMIIPHQANINIIKESLSNLGMPLDKTFCNIEKYGNTGGSSVGIALGEALELGVIKKGDLVILVAYGAGLCWGSVLIQF
ncbi:3-oxoacyl-ACP synthase III family protein [Streptococcus mutans]|uniref:3-oxoacyl-ACP synthase III family protein n=1 Tax=Streptococcus mutans TaxID=1309 RepID=UPI000F6EEC9E|nr:beta-ketoacyl-ACP synthase III [Streptococcus mutans]MCB5050635.1 ketoacyl-ACP synthase III [Streptococcus mutans]MCB5080072.1 ketoacyl-ACP synthase III [Streptococcus mutans]MCY7125218.1 ketoacyl-ACP synthase III [Streptococcus mutans]MDT9539617.1 ketoacyl-ACP synthase III [Streptococcus mutans]NLQ33798.1 ketoacyl-ACP synthase III [Streptococcus mutans]